MEPEVRALIERFGLRRLPVEGTLFAETYRSATATVMIGVYCVDPPSRSAFHRLSRAELWQADAGDAFRLVLLAADGTSREVVMGGDGGIRQLVVPAGTWQAGELLPGGRYALFRCTMAPGFTPDCFQASTAELLVAGWPERESDIRRLCVDGGALRMPDDLRE
jgi:predicted cupin superfamily sugar epimerase